MQLSSIKPDSRESQKNENATFFTKNVLFWKIDFSHQICYLLSYNGVIIVIFKWINKSQNFALITPTAIFIDKAHVDKSSRSLQDF